MKHALFIIISLTFIIYQCTPENKGVIDLEGQPDTAELFADGIVSTRMFERDIAITPEGDEIIYTLGDHGQTRRCLVQIKNKGKGWDEKEVLGFSGLYDDIEPFFSADGDKLYFSSNRPVEGDTTRTDYNIWVAERAADGWREPTPLPPGINSTNDEFYPSVSMNNNVYFTSVRQNGIGSEDIFISRFENGKYLDAEPLDTCINSATYEFNAYLLPDESLIVFSSYGRRDDTGGGDLYYSARDTSGKWKPAVNMGPEVNSVKLDYCPFIDIPRGNFYFTSDRTKPFKSRIDRVKDLEDFANQVGNGTGNIYRINLDKVLP
jgi:hypothetical protein